MAPRSRILGFGSAAALVLAGAVCAFAVEGLTGQVLAIALITVGLGQAVLLVFLEVGLSEERALAQEEERRRREERRDPDTPPRPGRPPRGRHRGLH